MKAALLILLVALPCLAQDSTNVVTMGGISYTNPTIRPLNLTDGVIISGTVGAKIKLADPPEPYRSEYYSEILVQREIKVREAAKEADAKAAQENKEKIERQEKLKAELEREKKAAQANSSTMTMDVGVSWNDDQLSLRNKGTPAVAGKTITVYINGTPPFAYKANFTAPDVGKSVVIPLRSFTKGGYRFDPAAQVVTVAWVGGAGYDYEGYQK